jgi:tetraacyldisaccharide 4'-kinase
MPITSIKRPWWEEILRGERRELWAKSLRQVAKLGSLGFKIGVKGRDTLYRRGLLRSRRLPHPTICVGNITVGGTGKTPLVIRLATDLMARGIRPGILLRGYRRAKKRRKPLIVRDSKRLLAGVEEAGDEAMELACRLPGSCVGVGVNRFAVGQALLKHEPVDCFILDDGFQHHRLEKDINIVTIDVSDPWGGGHLLPAGYLREPPDALRRADAVVMTGTGLVGPDRLGVLKMEVAGFTRPSSAIMESQHEPREYIQLPDRKRVDLDTLRGKKVLVVCGIGNPRSFESSLEAAGVEIAEALHRPDHDRSAAPVWSWVRERHVPGMPVVMTEKDATRWGDRIPAGISPVYALRMELVVRSGLEHWKNLVDFTCRLIGARGKA